MLFADQDEIGALSLILAGNHVERISPGGDRVLLQRLETSELAYGDQQMARMHSRSGKQALLERRDSIESFRYQLRLEQEGTLDAGI